MSTRKLSLTLVFAATALLASLNLGGTHDPTLPTRTPLVGVKSAHLSRPAPRRLFYVPALWKASVTVVSATKAPRVPRIPTQAPLVAPWVMAATERVQACEEGSYGWHVNGPKYFGGLGWLWATWQAFRRPDFPLNMADASPEQQAWAMQRFAEHYGFWPDQRGCTGGY